MAKALDFLSGDGPGPSRPKQHARAPREAVRESNAQAKEEDDDDAEEEEAIAQALHKQNVKSGAQVVKAATKGKGKQSAKSKDTIGGGSFQSMGEFRAP